MDLLSGGGINGCQHHWIQDSPSPGVNLLTSRCSLCGAQRMNATHHQGTNQCGCGKTLRWDYFWFLTPAQQIADIRMHNAGFDSMWDSRSKKE